MSPRGGTVLLVDDHAELRRALRGMLEALGWHVLEAGSGEQALALAASGEPPDVLVTDVVMPGIGGCELAERLRRSWPELPVLFISGHADERELRAAIQTGELEFLRKPFSRADFSGRLAALLLRQAEMGRASAGRERAPPTGSG